MPEMKTFPENFLWGAATSAFQVEGSPLADGAGESIWQRFAHTPGKIAHGDTADVACDHYRRWESDVELVRALGLNAYRFSIAWGRVLPEGTGRMNARGLEFYDRLVDRLLERGIVPNATLYHWDLPVALEDRGGWTNPDVANWFAEYADTCFRALGDRVPMWATLNEPWVIVDGGHLFGVHAPGRASTREAAAAARNLLLAHGAAVDRYRAGGWPHRIGVVVNLEMKDPASGSPEDLAATARSHTYFNEQFCDPLLRARNPEGGMGAIYGGAWRDWTPEELARVSRPIDFLGINYYTRCLTAYDPGNPPVFEKRVVPPGAKRMTTGWEWYPDGLGRTLRWVKERYGDVPLYVTENGGAWPDPPVENGRLEDPLRVETYRGNLRSLRAAIADGVDVRGYFAWSLMDNLEWASGYTQRFGLVHVDFATQARTIKASGEYYRRVIGTNGAALDD